MDDTKEGSCGKIDDSEDFESLRLGCWGNDHVRYRKLTARRCHEKNREMKAVDSCFPSTMLYRLMQSLHWMVHAVCDMFPSFNSLENISDGGAKCSDTINDSQISSIYSNPRS
jgi:hypothetical protein